MLTPSVAKMLAEGRSAGLEAVFAWQYSAQIRDEVIRSGVRSLLQSISIFRMREMEDARSLAGLAMEVYSDRISIDQDEQERLRFSPDDIVKLPIHRAINLWVADGVPRAGFLAHTLPMEDLHDERVAEHHLDAQRDRGGHHPEHLPDPLADTTRASSATDGGAATPHARRRSAAGAKPSDARCNCRATTATEQTAFIDARGVDVLPARATLDAHRYDGAAIQHDRRDQTVPCALQPRDVAIVARRLALQVPHRHPAARAAGGPTARRASAATPPRASSSTPATSNASDRHPHRGLLPLDLPPRPRRPPPAPAATGAHRPPRSASTPRTIYDYGHVLHELQLNAWVLACRRDCSAPRCSPGSGETDIEPPREASDGQLRLDDDRTAEGLRRPTPRLVRPDAILEIERRRRRQPRAS